MARPTNPQSRSVGNQGDVLKHAALFELATMLAKTCASVRYVDTHTYLLHAPIADAARWHREIDALERTHKAYAGYRLLERASLARTSRYRCSSGLVVDILGDCLASATLGEANGITRAELRDQIAEEHLTNALVTDDAVAALRDAPNGGADAVLVHVDPFSLTPELWERITPALDALCARSPEAVVVVYRYTRSGRSAWPTAPRNTVGPVAQTRGGPHEIAAYASAGLTDAVRAVCDALGWQCAAT